jgi:hypothetical protein
MSGSSTSDVNAIEVRIETISQLFFNLDPSPFREKDLDKDAEEFIVSWARELPSKAPVKIVVHLPVQELERLEAKEIGPAITQFFGYRAQVIGYEIRNCSALVGARSWLAPRYWFSQSLRVKPRVRRPVLKIQSSMALMRVQRGTPHPLRRELLRGLGIHFPSAAPSGTTLTDASSGGLTAIRRDTP